jgi:hypothetical protein
MLLGEFVQQWLQALQWLLCKRHFVPCQPPVLMSSQLLSSLTAAPTMLALPPCIIGSSTCGACSSA